MLRCVKTAEHSFEHDVRLAEQLAATRVGAAAKGVEVGGNTAERTQTEDGMEGARQGAEGEGSKEGADLMCRGFGSKKKRIKEGHAQQGRGLARTEKNELNESKPFCARRM